MEEAFQSDYKRRGARWAGAVALPPLPKDAVILETGCGNGKTLSALKNSRTVGIDIAKEAVRLAGCADAVSGDIRSLPFLDNSFDAVFCWHVLGHLKEADRKTAAEELFRVTKPGGTLFFKAFSAADFRCGKGEEAEPRTYLRGDGMLTHYFTKEETACLFGEGDITENRWSLRVRGTDLPRAEIIGIFKKHP